MQGGVIGWVNEVSKVSNPHFTTLSSEGTVHRAHTINLLIGADLFHATDKSVIYPSLTNHLILQHFYQQTPLQKIIISWALELEAVESSVIAVTVVDKYKIVIKGMWLEEQVAIANDFYIIVVGEVA